MHYCCITFPYHCDTATLLWIDVINIFFKFVINLMYFYVPELIKDEF